MSNDDVYEPDRLFLTPSDIPPELDSAYVYSAEGIRAAARDLLGAFSWNPGHRQFFPVKANPAPQILRLLLQGVVGPQAAPEAELQPEPPDQPGQGHKAADDQQGEQGLQGAEDPEAEAGQSCQQPVEGALSAGPRRLLGPADQADVLGGLVMNLPGSQEAEDGIGLRLL